MSTQIYFYKSGAANEIPNPYWAKGRISYTIVGINLEAGDIIRVQYAGRIWENIPDEPVFPNGPRGPFEAWRTAYQETISVYTSSKTISKNIAVSANIYAMRAVVIRDSNIVAISVSQSQAPNSDWVRGGLIVRAHNIEISAPTNFRVINNSVLNWNYAIDSEVDLPLKNFIVECLYVFPNEKYNYTVRRSINKNLRQYVFTNSRSGNVRYRIIPVDVSNKEGIPSIQLPSSNTTYSLSQTLPTGNNILFDSLSWTTQRNDWNNTSWIREALTDAAIRWGNYIRFNSTVYNNIKKFVEFKSNGIITYNGIRLNSVITDPSPNGTITCVPNTIYKISNTKFNTIDFNLHLSIDEDAISDQLASDPTYYNVLVKLMTHQLGHVLGIGTNWLYNTEGIFPYSLNDLSIKNYPNAQNNYNSYWRFRKRRSYIPLTWDESSDKNSTHWSSNRNLTNIYTFYHPGITHDIMSDNSVTDNDQISLMSTKTLLDFGYEEVNPNNSEFDSSSLATIQSSHESIECGLSLSDLDIKIAIDASNSNNIIFYDENLTLGT